MDLFNLKKQTNNLTVKQPISKLIVTNQDLGSLRAAPAIFHFLKDFPCFKCRQYPSIGPISLDHFDPTQPTKRPLIFYITYRKNIGCREPNPPFQGRYLAKARFWGPRGRDEIWPRWYTNEKTTGRTQRLCFFPWNFGASPTSLVDSERPNPPPAPAGRVTQTYISWRAASQKRWWMAGWYPYIYKKCIHIYFQKYYF